MPPRCSAQEQRRLATKMHTWRRNLGGCQSIYHLYKSFFTISLVMVTFRISGVNELGPLEENAATRGASRNPKIVFAGKIIVLACL